MKKIARHPINNIDFVLRSLERIKERLLKDFDNIQKRPQILGTYSRKILKTVSESVLVEYKKDEIINYMQIALLTGLGNFQSALNPGSSFNIYIGEKKLSFKGVETTAYIDTYQWELLYYLAIITRDKNSLDFLNSIPESLMKTANIEGDDADYKINRFYKGLFDSSVDIEDLLIEAMEAIDPDLHDNERLDYLLYIKGPELDLYGCFLFEELQRYNSKLEEAILDHKKYWGNEERDYDTEGWISYPLTAACVIAYDNKEYQGEIKSPYVPIWLVKHEF